MANLDSKIIDSNAFKKFPVRVEALHAAGLDSELWVGDYVLCSRVTAVPKSKLFWEQQGIPRLQVAKQGVFDVTVTEVFDKFGGLNAKFAVGTLNEATDSLLEGDEVEVHPWFITHRSIHVSGENEKTILFYLSEFLKYRVFSDICANFDSNFYSQFCPKGPVYPNASIIARFIRTLADADKLDIFELDPETDLVRFRSADDETEAARILIACK